jgi:hypothetical protein
MTPQLIAPTAEPIADAPKPGPTGPRTEEGKARTRLNAFRHGLTGQQFVFSPEEAELYANHFTQIQTHYEPQGPIEEALVRQTADGIWRLDRASAIEHGIFALALNPDSQNEDDGLNLARTWLQDGKSLALLSLYVKRIENKLDANKAELTLLQGIRKQEAAAAMNTAITLQKAAEIEGKTYQPEAYFNPPPAVKELVFSADLVAQEIARRDTFHAAQLTVMRAQRTASNQRRDAA